MKINKRRSMTVTLLALTAAILTCGVAAAAEGSFYKDLPLFSTLPDEERSVSSIDRFGPVGMGIELHQPAFVMKIKNIEEGSPAEATGKLKAGQIIETINGQKLADIDPRIQLARIMGEAEATDGMLTFVVKGKPDAKAEEVIVKIPVLGAYGKTWPLNCPKSDKIVRNLADHLAKQPWDGGVGLNGMQLLFMLSTGEEKDLAVVREWMKKTAAVYEEKPAPVYAWFVGYGGIPLAEYYLRTGDEAILPVLKKFADVAKRTQYLGGWAGRGGVPFLYNGGGHLNAAGTHVVTFLLLAKECGVDVDELTLQSALKQFYRFAGRRNNPYGDHRPETGFVDNGKVGALALAMAAAASLTPAGENSVYAKARDVSAVKGFYSTSWMLHGHTGGGIGEIWRSAAMGLMYHKNQKKYREFMDNRAWFYDLSRRWDGSFGILGGARYDDTTWGTGLALSYTVPRKTLRITGAPKMKFVHEYQLPERPWGTKADDAFLSLEAAVDKNGKSPAIDQETLVNDSAWPILRRLNAEDVSEETVRSYANHQDHGIRRAASMRAAGQGMNYLGWNVSKSDKALYPRLVVALLKSKDPRVRWAGANAVNTLLQELLTDETLDLLMGMIKDPDESWWVLDEALQAVSLVTAERIAPHVDTLLPFLKHEEWWLRNSAVLALTPVATDERCYKKILPVLAEVITTNQRANVLGPVNGIVKKLNDASPEVQKAAAEMLRRAYTGFPDVKCAPGGQDLEAAFDAHLENIARVLSETPGGFDLLFELSAKRFPEQALPHSKFYLANPDPDRFGARVRKALTPIIMEKMIPEYIGKNRVALLAEASREKQRRVEESAFPQGTLDGLTDLYRRVGVDDCNWRPFGPDLQDMEWEYYSFDPVPQEQVHWDRLISRFRKVTCPEGMADWFTVGFDAGKHGWKTGLPPFGQLNGQLEKLGRPYLTKKEGKYPHLLDDAGNWTVRNDVWYVQVTVGQRQNWLQPGVKNRTIGPELQFAHVMGHVHDEMVLVIKASQGNRSLGWDILPPGSERFTFDGRTYAGYKDTPGSWIEGEEKKPVNWYAGKQYDDFVKDTHEVLDNLPKFFPDYKHQGYEVAGFVWWQGHKDQNPAHASRYEQNLVRLIKSLRAEFKAPKAPFVLATIAFDGWKLAGPGLTVANAQLAVSGEKGKYPEFADNVKTVEARDFWTDVAVSPKNQGYHYNRNAETYMEVGNALGWAMAELVKNRK